MAETNLSTAYTNDAVDEETAKSWEREQKELKKRLVEYDMMNWQINGPPFSGLQYIGGVDISFLKNSDNLGCASLIICNYPELEVVYEDSETVELQQPYISGFLAFREVPFYLTCLQRLERTEPHLIPQVILVDGNGVLHQRGFGTACHLGVQAGIPTIGVAKKLSQVDGLCRNDQHERMVTSLASGGETFDLQGHSGKVWGKAMRSCDKTVKPIFVSVGHGFSLATATLLVQRCCSHRIPEPIRQADIRSKVFLRDAFPSHYPASSQSGKKAPAKYPPPNSHPEIFEGKRKKKKKKKVEPEEKGELCNSSLDSDDDMLGMLF